MLKVLANLLLVTSVTPGQIRYDQSQTGDYNVHLDLKNIEIVAFLDDSSLSNNEYDYDYGEMTLKPATSTSGTANDSSSELPTLNAETNQTVVAIENSTVFDSTELSTSTSVAIISSSTTNKPKRRCGAGFFRDANGRCRRLRKPSIKLDGLLHQAKDILMGKNNS